MDIMSLCQEIYHQSRANSYKGPREEPRQEEKAHATRGLHQSYISRGPTPDSWQKACKEIYNQKRSHSGPSEEPWVSCPFEVSQSQTHELLAARKTRLVNTCQQFREIRSRNWHDGDAWMWRRYEGSQPQKHIVAEPWRVKRNHEKAPVLNTGRWPAAPEQWSAKNQSRQGPRPPRRNAERTTGRNKQPKSQPPNGPKAVEQREKADKDTNGSADPEGKDDQILAQLMEEKESTMEKIKEVVGLTKNEEQADDQWESFLRSVDMTNDPNITRGCPGERGCSYHCTACDKHLSGYQPLRDHQKSQNHRKKIGQKVGEAPAARPRGSRGPNQDGRLGSCGQHACTHHCYTCDKCMTGPTPAMQHLDSDKHRKRERELAKSGNTGSPPGDYGRMGDVASNGSQDGSSHSGDVEDAGRLSASTSFIKQNECTSIGCSYHCICCDKHLSGEQPMLQHLKSLPHQNMQQVYTKEMTKPSPQPHHSSDTESVFSFTSMLDSLSVSSSGNEADEITGPCGKIGCAFHCTLCSTCLSGAVPKDQHVVSKKHSQVRERLTKATKPATCPDPADELGLAPPSPDSGVEFTECTQPGCAYHCHVCDAHLTGLEPMKQHRISKNHEKRTRATVKLQMQPRRSSGDSNQGDGDDVVEDACSQPGCRFHCTICDLHLSGRDPMKQHMESQKHEKKKLAFLKLGPKNSETNEQPSSIASSPPSIVTEMNPFAVGRQQPKPIGYERSMQSRSPPSSPPSNDFPQQGISHTGFAQSRPVAQSTPNCQRPGAGSSPENQSDGKDVFGACPENSRICKFHCFACDKHFNERLPKEQHGTSSKHKKLAQRYLAGLKTRDIQQSDSFISKSVGSTDLQLKTQLKTSRLSSALTGLPKWLGEDRQLPPTVKAPGMAYNPETRTVARDYQMELYRKAMNDDTVCFLPTGTGKTLVSALVIDHMLELNPTRPVLFLVEKILLVLQQTKYLRTELGQKKYQRLNPRTNSMELRPLNIAGLCSGHTDACGKSSLQELDIIVATAGFFMNVLTKDWLKWKDFSLVVIDEVHHCTKKHAYNTLMLENHLELSRELRPKLLGMTASPAGEANVPLTQTMLEGLLENIGMAKLAIVEDHEEQLGDYQTRTTLEVELAEMSEEETQLEDEIQMYLLHIFNFLVKTTNLGNLCKELGLNIQEGKRAIVNADELAGEGLEAFRSSLGMIEVKEKCRNMGRFIKKIISHADAVCGALLGLRLCGEEAVYHSLQPVAEETNCCGFDEMAQVGFSCQALQLLKDSYQDNVDERRQKMTAFWRLVDKIVRQIEWNEMQERKPIVMVIVRERKVAKLLATLLQSNVDVRERGLNVEFIVGHGDGDVGMSVSRQRKILEDTWQHRYQVLVATSVAEEGLDLPECKLVIEMDPPGNVTSLVQIRGRARKQCSRLVALCRNEDQVGKIKELEEKEQCMMIAARAVVSQQKLAAQRALASGTMLGT